MFPAAVAPPFDIFSLSRSMQPFALDLYRIPQKVKKAVDVGTEVIISLGINSAKRAKGNHFPILAGWTP